MTLITRAQAARVARLARLRVGDDELDALAPQLADITRDFSSLQTYAATLPPASQTRLGAPRADEVSLDANADAIIAQSQRLDKKTRMIRG